MSDSSIPDLDRSRDDARLEEAWAAVEEAWDDPEVHRHFRALCLAAGRLPFAGERYRMVRDRDPARREDAERHIDALIAFASAALTWTRPSPSGDRSRRRIFYLALGMSLTMIGYALFSFVNAR